jgi:hypothetical protein
VAALFLAGCNGGTVDRQDLTKDGETVDSVACEGALLADGVARGRTTVFFTRVHADALELQMDNLADALSTRKALPALERRVRAKARDAAAVAAALHRLHDHPGDRAVGAEIREALTKAGDCS